MTDRAQEEMDRTQQEREAEHDDLLEEQEGESYGEDEGDRDDGNYRSTI